MTSPTTILVACGLQGPPPEHAQALADILGPNWRVADDSFSYDVLIIYRERVGRWRWVSRLTGGYGECERLPARLVEVLRQAIPYTPQGLRGIAHRHWRDTHVPLHGAD